MKITMYELLGMIKDGKAPEKIKFNNDEWYWGYDTYIPYSFLDNTPDVQISASLFHRYRIDYCLNKEVDILEEEKKIPEKHINNYGDLIILGQQDNWLEPTIETDQKIYAQLNPYVFEAINENFKDIENKIYEIIDFLKQRR